MKMVAKLHLIHAMINVTKDHPLKYMVHGLNVIQPTVLFILQVWDVVNKSSSKELVGTLWNMAKNEQLWPTRATST